MKFCNAVQVRYQGFRENGMRVVFYYTPYKTKSPEGVQIRGDDSAVEYDEGYKCRQSGGQFSNVQQK